MRNSEEERVWGNWLARVHAIVKQYPVGSVVDPDAVARRAELDAVDSIAMLRVLEERGHGLFILRVVNGSGSEMRRFRTLREIPEFVSNEFGDTIRVMPENIDFGFERLAGPSS